MNKLSIYFSFILMFMSTIMLIISIYLVINDF